MIKNTIFLCFLLISAPCFAFSDNFLSGFPSLTDKDKNSQIQGFEYNAGNTPEQTYAAYMEATRNLAHHWDMDFYSEKTKEMFKNRRPVTKTQLKNAANELKECPSFRTKYSDDGKYAITYSKVSKRNCNPYFYVLEQDNKWRLDMDTMSKAMVMDNKNRWRFRKNYMDHPYMPIFESMWRIDKNGWPYLKN
jgi:hypothetical protein